MVDLIIDILLWTWKFTKEAAPWLLLGLLFAGLLKAFVPSEIVLRYLGKGNLRSILMATLVGIPLPLCSCGVIPTGLGLYKSGASKASTLAFFIATPATTITTILIAVGMLGWKFALAEVLTCFGVAIATGLLAWILLKESETAKPTGGKHNANTLTKKLRLGEGIKAMLHYGFVDMVDDIGLYVLIGLLGAGIIAALAPPDLIQQYLGRGLLPLVIMVLIGAPMYICSTGSVPFVAALIEKGMNPSAGLVFLIVGPATNLSTILVIAKSMGRETAALYVSSMIVFSILIAYSFGLGGWL
ncbi:MAG: permease [Methanocellales archaeon]|nr:permease [Methanocellales archaeon]